MVRLVLHNTSGEKATIRFGTTDGGMSISGTSDKVEFIGGDEPLMSVEREVGDSATTTPAPADTIRIEFFPSVNTTAEMFVATAKEVQVATLDAGFASRYEVFLSNDANSEKRFLVMEQYTSVDGLAAHLNMMQTDFPEFLAMYQGALVYIFGDVSTVAGDIYAQLGVIEQLGADVINQESGSIRVADYIEQ